MPEHKKARPTTALEQAIDNAATYIRIAQRHRENRDWCSGAAAGLLLAQWPRHSAGGVDMHSVAAEVTAYLVRADHRPLLPGELQKALRRLVEQAPAAWHAHQIDEYGPEDAESAREITERIVAEIISARSIPAQR